MGADRIEKQALLSAPLDRVWDAISDSAKFGTWFGMEVDGPFVEGAAVSGRITETSVDEAIAEQQRPYVGEPVTLWIVAVEPKRRFAFRWNALPGPEFAELTTLVEFTLTDGDDGVLLQIVESGFDALPDEHRATTFNGNSEGWAIQVQLVGKYLALETQR
ncbi:SRPBCC family protein [soil metagenome]